MGFTFLALAYIIGLVFSAFLIFFAIWHVIAFDEIKNDQKNPIDQCKTLNPLVLPEYFLHGSIAVLTLLGGDLFTVAINIPLIIYHVRKFRNRKVLSGFGIYDPTFIMNGDVLNFEMKEGWIKLGFYMISFFYYLYCFISALIAAN